MTITDTQIVEWLIAERNEFWSKIEADYDAMHQAHARRAFADRTLGGLTFPAKSLSWRLTREELAAAVQQRVLDTVTRKLIS